MRITGVAFKDFPPLADGVKGAEVHFLVGPNGSGKTRLLSLLLAALGNVKELESRLDGKLDAQVFADHQLLADHEPKPVVFADPFHPKLYYNVHELNRPTKCRYPAREYWNYYRKV